MTYEKELHRQVNQIAAILNNFCSEVGRAYELPNKEHRANGVRCDLATLKEATKFLLAAEKKIVLLRECIEEDEDMKKAIV